MKKILICEDEQVIREFIVINLNRSGFKCLEAESGEQALELYQSNPDIDIALLDIMLPGIDGFEVCKRIRETNNIIGIIFLTAKSQEMDKVTGLMTGADDYIQKPFSPIELTARIDALYRRVTPRAQTSTDNIISSGPFTVNLTGRYVLRDGQMLDLTQVEYQMMKAFIENPEAALSREQLLNKVWGNEVYIELKVVDVNVRRLRMKVEKDPSNPDFIQTIWGYGYKWIEKNNKK